MNGEQVTHPYIILAVGVAVLALVTLGVIYFLLPDAELIPSMNKVALEPRVEQPKTEHYPYGESSAFLLREGNEPENRLYRDARATWTDLKDYSGALKKYEEAFRVIKGEDGKAQIKYEMALVKNESGDPIGAIQLLKEVAIMVDVSNLIRASAIDQMGQIFYSRGDERIFEEIFKGAPFESFLEENKLTSVRNLLEFGSSFYPLAWSELEIANWYATALIYRRTNPKSSYRLTEEEVKSIIREKIANANQDIERLREVYTSDSRIVGFTFRKAVIASKLEQLGDPFLGDPEILFKKSLDESRVMGVSITEAFILYQFAVHLAKTDPTERLQDIKSLLNEFYSGNKFSNSPFFEFLRNERTNVLNNRENIQLLAQIDPQFKTLLNQLGWNL